MPRIRCHYTDCVFIDDGYCSAAAVEFDPDTGCATYSPADGAVAGEENGKKKNWKNGKKRTSTRKMMIYGLMTKKKNINPIPISNYII